MNSEESCTNLEEYFFFDSYAFFEILRANERYSRYKEAEIVTTKLNLFELYSGILREKTETEAKEILDLYYSFAIDFDNITIEEAAKFKNKLNVEVFDKPRTGVRGTLRASKSPEQNTQGLFDKRNVSMRDCIGYILTKQLGIKFLTGDKEFEHLDNVEFVK